MPSPMTKLLTRDYRDALQDARAMAQDAERAYNDNAEYERQLRLKYIEAAFNFLIEAKAHLEGTI